MPSHVLPHVGIIGSVGLDGWLCHLFNLLLGSLPLSSLSLFFVFFLGGGGEGHIFKSLYVQLKRLES